ncbi:MAG: bis(5'-nucleosyl)-tetraphosphatase (symmetrical) YqeK, partial [Defluviitaleaceae bacterium]|nr:bis(5'-nucleosyl)-tetraphosphatase (symmetrical) YqeK [Defluviitaleaceae bacterium]
RRICPPDAEIFFVIGADALAEILMWEGAERLLKLCKLIAVRRPGYEICEAHIKNLRENFGAEIFLLDGPNLNFSGTEIRERFFSNKPVGGFVPKAVENYAKSHGLYDRSVSKNATATEARVLSEQINPLSPERFEAAKKILEQRLSSRRFKHTLGTVIAAEKLAAHYGADVEKARWAALLHDCAKEFSAAKKFFLCNLWGVALDEIICADIDVAHSWLGAESAKRDFFVADPEILQAISRHTIGCAGMTLFDKIIMLADYIEPFRTDYAPLEAMRAAAYADINAALLIGMADTNADLEERGKPVHPWSLDAFAEIAASRK